MVAKATAQIVRFAGVNSLVPDKDHIDTLPQLWEILHPRQFVLIIRKLLQFGVRKRAGIHFLKLGNELFRYGYRKIEAEISATLVLVGGRSGGLFLECHLNASKNRFPEHYGNRVPQLSHVLGPTAVKNISVWKSLETARFADGEVSDLAVGIRSVFSPPGTPHGRPLSMFWRGASKGFPCGRDSARAPA